MANQRFNINPQEPVLEGDPQRQLFSRFWYLTFQQLAQAVAAVINLTVDVTGRLPYANMPILAASRLLGRGSAVGVGNQEPITVGSGLTMSGTTLQATGGNSQGLADVLMLMGG